MGKRIEIFETDYGRIKAALDAPITAREKELPVPPIDPRDVPAWRIRPAPVYAKTRRQLRDVDEAVDR